jgi:hypothetical protein
VKLEAAAGDNPVFTIVWNVKLVIVPGVSLKKSYVTV